MSSAPPPAFASAPRQGPAGIGPLRTGRGRNRPARLLEAVQEAAAAQGLVLDAGQLHVAGALAGSAARALARRTPAAAPGEHLYVWGPPGRGKSWLMDSVCNSLAGAPVRRVHFHGFFRELHARTHRASQDRIAARRHATAAHATGVPPAVGAPESARTQRQAGPAAQTPASASGSAAGAQGAAIAEALDGMLGGARILFFDEFHVHDPGDGMLVTRALREIFARGILLVVTSNYAPQDLLPDPMFHHLFEPAIGLITERMSVLELAGPVDYRTLRPSNPVAGYAAGHLLVPGTAGQLASAGLEEPAPSEEALVKPTTHAFTARRATGGQLWFRFADLCEAPSATSDYLALAAAHRHWVLGSIPALKDASPSGWRRFANLVDVLYDQDVRLDLIGAGDIEPARALGHPVDASRLASRLAALRRN
ncbi:cell division protein ZapE [Zafaria cholistanensis]|uniref:Cell division protein ZapE n=1 Tax=Zafaria cholistanensis TaxID=1682741 RepID=A0A5A7NQL1_9MICC|nr:cell division protein ZapE [Zafaria cholistanensis]GER22108.1 cell division protein ZapE [Zafaria cholistanensis]